MIASASVERRLNSSGGDSDSANRSARWSIASSLLLVDTIVFCDMGPFFLLFAFDCCSVLTALGLQLPDNRGSRVCGLMLAFRASEMRAFKRGHHSHSHRRNQHFSSLHAISSWALRAMCARKVCAARRAALVPSSPKSGLPPSSLANQSKRTSLRYSRHFGAAICAMTSAGNTKFGLQAQ